MSVTRAVDKVDATAPREEAGVLPWISRDEDFRKSDDLSTLRRRLLDEGDGLIDTSFEVVPCRFSLDGSDLELLTGNRHGEILEMTRGKRFVLREQLLVLWVW